MSTMEPPSHAVQPEQDCEKELLRYQVEERKDITEELEEQLKIVQKEIKIKSRQHDLLNRDYIKLKEEFQRQTQHDKHCYEKIELEHQKLITNYQQLEQELEKYKANLEDALKNRDEKTVQAVTQVQIGGELTNNEILTSPEKLLEFYRDASKQIREHQYKHQKAEKELALLQTHVSRQENLITRLKQSLKEDEEVQDELRSEKRKLLRDLREAQAEVEELKTTNVHLQNRLDKARSRNLPTAGAAVNTTITQSPSIS